MTKIQERKQELKELAKEIREMKNRRGPSNNGFVYGLSDSQFTFRVRHIAYCLARGRSLEEIEKFTREENKLSKYALDKIEADVITLKGATHEDVHISA